MDQLRGGGGAGAGAGLRPVSRGVIVFQWRELPRDIARQGAIRSESEYWQKWKLNIILDTTVAWP